MEIKAKLGRARLHKPVKHKIFRGVVEIQYATSTSDNSTTLAEAQQSPTSAASSLSSSRGTCRPSDRTVGGLRFLDMAASTKYVSLKESLDGTWK